MAQNNSVQVFEGGWKELENAIFTDNQTNISTNPESHFLRPNGRSVSVIVGADIETYPIGLPYYDPDQVGALSDTFELVEPANAIGHCWNDNGTVLYVVDQDFKELLQYDVPTPYLPSSIVGFSSGIISLSAVTGDVLQVIISRDGDFIFITDGTSVYSFPLPTKDDITSNVSNTVFTPGGGINVDSFALKREGDKIYTGDITNNLITEYVTTAPNIIVGATANGNTLSLPAAPALIDPHSITFRSNGKQLFVLDRTASSFTRIHLDDKDRDWNISTASYFPNDFPSSDYQSVFWKPDGTRFFGLNSGAADRIEQLDVPTRWNVDDKVVTTSFDLAGIAQSPRGIWVTPDGLTCFVVDSDSDSVVQLDMSTGWDVSTMSAPGITFDLAGAAGINNASGISFTKDQLKYYVTGSQTDDVFEFDIPAGLDLANSTFTTNSLDLSSIGDLTDVRIKPDDNLIYFSVRLPDRILMFSLPVDGNISNAVFLADVNVEDVEDNLQGFFIRENDGKQMLIGGQSANAVETMDVLLEFNNSLISDFGEDITTDIGDTIVYT